MVCEHPTPRERSRPQGLQGKLPEMLVTEPSFNGKMKVNRQQKKDSSQGKVLRCKRLYCIEEYTIGCSIQCKDRRLYCIEEYTVGCSVQCEDRPGGEEGL